MDEIIQRIQGCLENDRAHWDTLIKQCHSIVSGILRRSYSSTSRDDQDDIIQNVFCKLVKSGLSSFQGTTGYEFIRYLQQITVHEASSYRRQNLRHDSTASLDQEHGTNTDGQSLHHLLQDNRLRPDTIATVNDLYRTAMAHLSIRDRQILLYKIEGYKDREIAELLGLPIGTVATNYNRIKTLLKQTLLAAVLMRLFERKLAWMASLS